MSAQERQESVTQPLQDTLVGDLLEADDPPHEEGPPDDDSVYAVSENSASYQTSLASSIINYKYENGRRYHAFRAGTYILPNDETEQDRMDLVHHVYGLLLDGELCRAPIPDNPQRVLDLGTGTGIWAMDFADEYPSAEVIGTDLSPIQPEWTPPNCIFEVDDFETDWLYTKPFDFIHAREIEGCISDGDRLFRRAFQHLKPGGYIEFQAAYPRWLSDDGTAEKAKNAQGWLKALIDGSIKFGKPLEVAVDWKEKMEKAGFVDVREEVRKSHEPEPEPEHNAEL
ncbi:hypothetical protein CEP52_016643 [Fusarium oligoseptatum]|uniref:Methyltransferase n=1 Tax=Fusarium oligoseptatum TaxID=2604345 RepID=A0A428S1M3_9HYPO|nr:hypothetical protein CEP52_016643 [Fusarium oligoseptatum]